MSKILKVEDSTKSKEKTFYVFIIFSKTKETEIAFKFDSEITSLIHSSKQSIEGGFRYIIVLKHILTPKNPSEKEIDLSFNNKGEIFKVSFSTTDGTFIFNPTLKIKKNKIANEKSISQKQVIKITEKIDIFAKCLEEAKENTELGTLYSDSIDFFSLNQDFELIIYLFNKVCGIDQIFKDICKKLLDIFWEKTTNDNIKQLNNQSESCKQFLDNIKEIASNSEKFISENGFDKAKFYGFILFYLNSYDPSQFQ